MFSAVQRARRVAWWADEIAEEAEATRVDPASLPGSDALGAYLLAMHEDDLVGVAAIFEHGFRRLPGESKELRAIVCEQRARLESDGRENFAAWLCLRTRDRACTRELAPGGARYVGDDHVATRAFVHVLDQFGGQEAGPGRVARILSTVLRPLPEHREDDTITALAVPIRRGRRNAWTPRRP